MIALATMTLTLWVATFIVRPGRPLPGNEVQELVYARLLGRQHLLMVFAAVVTGAVLLVGILSLPVQINRDLHQFREPCEQMTGDHERCFTYENGAWQSATPTPYSPRNYDTGNCPHPRVGISNAC